MSTVILNALISMDLKLLVTRMILLQAISIFFITNPETGVSKITYFKPESDTSILSDSDIESMVEGSESLCSGMKTLLEDNEQDPMP